MNKRKKHSINDFHFRYGDDLNGQRVKNFLKNQSHKSQSVELAILLAINTFGDEDLVSAIENWILDKNINVYSEKSTFSKQQPTSTANKVDKKESIDATRKSERKNNDVSPNKEKHKPNTTHSKKNKAKQTEKEKIIPKPLSSEEINKMLWDGNSSNL